MSASLLAAKLCAAQKLLLLNLSEAATTESATAGTLVPFATHAEREALATIRRGMAEIEECQRAGEAYINGRRSIAVAKENAAIVRRKTDILLESLRNRLQSSQAQTARLIGLVATFTNEHEATDEVAYILRCIAMVHDLRVCINIHTSLRRWADNYATAFV